MSCNFKLKSQSKCIYTMNFKATNKSFHVYDQKEYNKEQKGKTKLLNQKGNCNT
jgi:hypothetical protein